MSETVKLELVVSDEQITGKPRAHRWTSRIKRSYRGSKNVKSNGRQLDAAASFFVGLYARKSLAASR